MALKSIISSIFVLAVLLIAFTKGSSETGAFPLPVANKKSDLIYRNSIVDASTSNNSIRCGGVLTETSDLLVYKNATQLEPNERCVWIIRVQNATRYLVNVKQMGFGSDANGTQIILTGTGILPRTIIADHFIPTRENPMHIFSDRNVIMITFHTGNSAENSTGFILEYSALPNPDSTIKLASPRSVDFFDTPSALPASIHHPVSGMYANNELSFFVLAPGNNSIQRGLRSEVFYTRTDLDLECFDALHILKFESSLPGPIKWENAGMICSDIANARINHADLMVILFRTDESNTYTGFQLTYETGCNVDDDSNIII